MDSTININLVPKDEIKVFYGTEAHIDNKASVLFIKSGQKEIDDYVETVSKPDISNYVETEAKPLVTQIINEIAEPTVEEYIEGTVKPDLDEYADSLKPELQAYVTQASNYADNSQASATASAGSAAASLTYANNASQSATSAQSSANNATSSKNAAASSAISSSNYSNNSKVWAEGSESQVQALGGVHSAKGWAEEKNINNFVHKTGDETIYGYKTFRNDNSAASVFIQGYLGLSENPAISGGQAQLEFHDKNGAWEGIVGVERYTNGQRLLKFQLKDQDGAQNRIELVRDQNGVWYATCPTPSSVSDNSTKIATTAWVRQVAALKDLSNITKPYVTETYQNGASWYRVWSDGWCEQGGQCVISQAAWVTITFLKSFINTEYVATGGSKVLDSSYPNNPLNVSFRNYTTTSVQSAVNDDTTINKGTWTWRVCGYIS